MRLIHAADLHLDSPMRGLTRLGDDALADTLRKASRGALKNLVALAVDQKAAALLLAGDIYDGDWPDYTTGAFFAKQLARLDDEGIRVFMVAGNHDAQSEITRALSLPPNVKVLSTAAPETIVDDELGLAIHGQGYATKAVLTNLAAAYPDRLPGLINVGLLHTSVEGTVGHERYAPCQLADLTALGYDYFALGHVHKHLVLAGGEHAVAYSGNLQGRNPRETGPKGAVVVDLTPGEPARLTFHALDVARWAVVPVPVGGCATLDDALAQADGCLRAEAVTADGRPLVARLEFTGTSRAAAGLADAERLDEEVALIAGRLGVCVEKVVVRVISPAQRHAVESELQAALRSAALGFATDEGLARGALRGLDKEVGRLLREAGLLDLSSPDTLTRLVGRAANSLVALLDGEVS